MSQGFSTNNIAFAGNGVTQLSVNGVPVSASTADDHEFAIPTGVKRFTVSVSGVTLTSSSSIRFELGDASSIEVIGYTIMAGYISDGAGGAGAITNNSVSVTSFHTSTALTSKNWHGTATFVLMDAATNLWSYTWTGADSAALYIVWGAGSKALTGELTRVNVTQSGTGFDAGTINVQYENPDPTVVADSGHGIVVQTVHSQDGEFASGTTVMPLDDTIPQITEGVEFLSASITPNNVANKLRIDVVLYLSHTTTSSYMLGALFQDSTASALAAAHSGSSGSAGGRTAVTFTHWMDAGTLSSTTFSVRAGNANAGTTRLNGGTTRSLGGVLASSITITEYES